MKKLITAEDLTQIVSVSHPVYSPDGKKAVFTKVTVNEKKDDYNIHLWVRDEETGSCLDGHLMMESIISQHGQKTESSLRLFCRSQRKSLSSHSFRAMAAAFVL